MAYICRTLNDPQVDELRDAEGKFFGRAPVQGWLRPISVSLRRPTFRDLLEGKFKVDPDGPTDRLFAVHTPWAAPTPPNGYVKPRPRLFEDFVSMGSASDDEIHRFASRYGPLMIFCRAEPGAEKTCDIIRERSDVWRYFARSMKSLLRIAANLHAGRRGSSSDWDAIGNAPFAVDMARGGLGTRTSSIRWRLCRRSPGALGRTSCHWENIVIEKCGHDF